jgi:hypothetical protein
MSFRQKKQVTQTGATSITITFDQPLIANNLVIVTVSSNDGTCTNDAALSTAIEVYDVVNDDFLRITYGVVAAGGVQSYTFTGFAGNTKNLGGSEWDCNNIASPLDTTASTGTTNPTTVTTINSNTVTKGVQPSLAVVMTSVRASISAPTFNNGFQLLNQSLGTFSDFSGFLTSTATGTISCDLSWTTSGVAIGAAIVIFNARDFIEAPSREYDVPFMGHIFSIKDDGKFDTATSVNNWW